MVTTAHAGMNLGWRLAPSLVRPRPGRARRGAMILALLTCASTLGAQVTSGAGNVRNGGAPAAGEQSKAKSAGAPFTGITYEGGQLHINVQDMSLSDVLARICALTGLKIEIPPGTDKEVMPLVNLGPAPAREVLSDLLSDSDFDYLIQSSDTKPDDVASVMLMPRGKRAGGSNGTVVASRQPGAPASRTAARPVEQAETRPPDPAPVQPATPAPDTSAAAQPAPVQPDPSSVTPLSDAPGQLNSARIAPQPVPAMNTQSISQTLQQMYAQRMQLAQQGAQVTIPVVPSSSGGGR